MSRASSLLALAMVLLLTATHTTRGTAEGHNARERPLMEDDAYDPENDYEVNSPSVCLSPAVFSLGMGEGCLGPVFKETDYFSNMAGVSKAFMLVIPLPAKLSSSKQASALKKAC